MIFVIENRRGGKEDKSAFIARTQAQRQARQANKQQVDAAEKIQAFLRKTRAIKVVRSDAARSDQAAIIFVLRRVWC